MSDIDDNDQARLHETLYDFDLWSDIHVRHEAINHPSELHGLLTGELAAGERLSSDRWEALALEHLGCDQLLTEAVEDQPTPKGAAARVLRGQSGRTAVGRHGLPAAAAAGAGTLGQRLEALSNWVRGFLEGMAGRRVTR